MPTGQKKAVISLALRITLLAGFYFLVYLFTPKDLAWHLGTSLERLVTHIFPSFILLFFLLLPAGLVEHLGWLTIPVSVLVAGFFALLEMLSIYLQDPFENRSSDTPVSAICRTIEIVPRIRRRSPRTRA